MWNSHTAKSVTVERDKLYEQVWSVPGSQLSAQYGISDVGLAKVCRRHNIPRPPRGYWAKLRAGKPVKRIPLPRSKGEEKAMIQMHAWGTSDEAIQELAANAATEPSRIDIVSTEHASHPIVAVARSQLRAAKPNHLGILCTDSATAPDVQVSASCVDRALATLELLIQKWEARGGTFATGQSGTGLAVGDDRIGITLSEELNESRPVTDPTYRTGRLRFTLTGLERHQFRRRWADTQSQKVERLIPTMLLIVQHVLTLQRTERLDEECRQRQKVRVEQHRQTIEDFHSRAFFWRQDLMTQSRQWEDAQRIRGYLSALRTALDAGHLQPKNLPAFQEWFEWAQAYADSIDPTLRRPLPGKPQATDPRNTPTSDLDLTSTTRTVVDRLNSPDTDSLWRKTRDEVREASDHRSGAAWNEINQVLEALGYDVSKRENSWW